MRRGRLSNRERRVLSTIGTANADGHQWVSGFDIFQDLRATARFGGANHGRVFSVLRSLTSSDYLRVRIETVAGTGTRATYRLTERGAAAHADTRIGG
ncbi:MAG: hypothetical protein JWM93_3485 [Frankiales bacterium]|nr:hypothetical protein [Frankiales bacterium]